MSMAKDKLMQQWDTNTFFVTGNKYKDSTLMQTG